MSLVAIKLSLGSVEIELISATQIRGIPATGAARTVNFQFESTLSLGSPGKSRQGTRSTGTAIDLKEGVGGTVVSFGRGRTFINGYPVRER